MKTIKLNNATEEEQNVQALAPAVAETALQNSEQNPVATAGCQQRSCSAKGFGEIISGDIEQFEKSLNDPSIRIVGRHNLGKLVYDTTQFDKSLDSATKKVQSF